MDLARAAAAGDAQATDQLVRAVSPALARVVKTVLGPEHPDVDDGIQRALIGFVDALPSYRGDCEPVAYGRVIALHAAFAVRRKVARDAARREAPEVAEALVSPAPSPGEEAAAARRMEIFRELLEELPEAQAEAFAMRVILDLSLEEIAEHVGAPINTVRSRMRIARERLRQRIESDPWLREALGVK
jgi:RNA polymerase sigma-70 factor (ECF subfamily)